MLRFDHERLDGRGYPFHIDGDELSLGSKTMAMADVFTALTEHRPYRDAMPLSRAFAILVEMAETGALDGEFTHLLERNLSDIDEARHDAQVGTATAFEDFHRRFRPARIASRMAPTFVRASASSASAP